MMARLNDKLRAKAQNIKFFFTDVDGTLTDGGVYYTAEGEKMKKFSLRDGTGFFLLRQSGIKTGIITTEKSIIVEQRAKKLKVDAYVYGTEHKKETLESFLKEKGLSFENIAFIGDEVNDLKLLRRCGLSFAVADADKRVKGIADFVCVNKGGDGAFREAVEVLLELKDVNIEEIIQDGL